MNSAILIISLLLLPSLLIHEAQGMGLMMSRKETLSNSHQFISHKTVEGKITEHGVEEVNNMWKSKHFSGIRSRKLMITSPIPTAATMAKNNEEKKEKSAKKEEDLSINSSLSSPGILDLAGMDYSQARRKPPIHN